MPSIDSKDIIDKIIANNGHYSDDPRAFAIHQYTTRWGGQCYHVAYSQRELDRLFDYDSAAINPVLIWDRMGRK
jgi:hypothetical protein